MPATTELNTPERPGTVVNLPVAAATKIYAGTLVAINSSGYAVPAADSAGLKAIGRAEATVDNTGSAGDERVDVKRGVFQYANSGTAAVDPDDVGKVCYVEDDGTVAETSANAVIAGIVLAVEDEGVWIDTRYHLHAVGTAADGSITLAKLAAAVAPSHVAKLAGILTMGGGNAAEAETVTGAAATDIVLATIVDNASNDNVILIEAKPTTNTITFLFNEDPGEGVKVAYAILRATS